MLTSRQKILFFRKTSDKNALNEPRRNIVRQKLIPVAQFKIRKESKIAQIAKTQVKKISRKT